jgi:ubiquitin C-terminal hydrolase
MFPLRGRVLQARWSGESLWVPLGERRMNLERENAMSRAVSGQLLFYPGDVSEMEILLPYGLTDFACKYGELAGNHFATIVNAGAEWQDFGEHIWWHGAQDITIDEV